MRVGELMSYLASFDFDTLVVVEDGHIGNEISEVKAGVAHQEGGSTFCTILDETGGEEFYNPLAQRKVSEDEREKVCLLVPF